jgi:hypothetical protein
MRHLLIIDSLNKKCCLGATKIMLTKKPFFSGIYDDETDYRQESGLETQEEGLYEDEE